MMVMRVVKVIMTECSLRWRMRFFALVLRLGWAGLGLPLCACEHERLVMVMIEHNSKERSPSTGGEWTFVTYS